MIKNILILMLMISCSQGSSSNTAATSRRDVKKDDIFTAVIKGDIKLVKKYISLNSNLSDTSKDHDDKTAIHLAAENGHTEIVEELIKAGAVVSKESINSDEAIRAAVEKGHVEVLKALLEGIDNVDNAEHVSTGRRRENNRDWFLIHLAAQHGHDEVVKFLLSKGAKIDKLIKYHTAENHYKNMTALMIASKEGYLDVVETLIKEGADIDLEVAATDVYKDNNGYTALHFAAKNGYKEIVKLLVDKGADVNKKTYFGYTPLMYAVTNGYKEIVEMLIDNKANINDSLLISALSKDHKDIVNILLKKDEVRNEINTIDKNGKTALHIAADKENSIDMIETLIEAGADISILSEDYRFSKGYIALHFAAQNRNSEAEKIVEKLKGENSNNINKKEGIVGYTPLHLAVIHNKLEMVKALLESGADVNIKDNSDRKARYYVEYTEMAELFEKYN